MRRPKTRAQAFVYLTCLFAKAWGPLARDASKAAATLAKHQATAYYETAVEWTPQDGRS